MIKAGIYGPSTNESALRKQLLRLLLRVLIEFPDCVGREHVFAYNEQHIKRIDINNGFQRAETEDSPAEATALLKAVQGSFDAAIKLARKGAATYERLELFFQIDNPVRS